MSEPDSGAPGDTGLDAGPPLTEHETAVLARLESDLERVLGVGVGIGAIELDPGGPPIVIHATLMAEGKVRDVEAEGDTLEAACGDLLEKAADVRLDGSFWRIVGDI